MKQRVVTSLALAPLIITASILSSPYPFFLLCLVVATLGFWELRHMLGQPKALPVLTLFGLAVTFFGTEIQQNRSPRQIVGYACLFWLVGIFFTWKAARKTSGNVAEVDLAGLWLSMPLVCMLMVQKAQAGSSPFQTHPYLLLLILPIWAGDIAALLVGKWIGKHMLWPAVSPKKTWEGSIANLVAAVAVAMLLLPLLQTPNGVVVHLACGLAVGVFGQAGDLFESYVKRRSGVKDSGSLLPGHGGLLDRIDSLLFAAPIVALILALTLLLHD